jgi:hypothetical protein
VPNLWPWKDRRVPANRSFRDIVNGAPNSLRSAPDGTRNGRLDPAKSAHDLGLSLPWPTLLCAAIAIVAFSGSIYCAVGYVHYKQIAGTERAAAQRAESANADLQEALDRMRDQLALATARIDRRPGEAMPPIALSNQGKADRGVQLTRAFGAPDLQLSGPQPATLISKLSLAAAKLPDEHLQQSSASFGLDQTQENIRQLGAEYHEVARERDQLRERLSELEEKLSLSLPPQAPQQAAKVPPNSISGSTATGGTASIIFPRSAADGPVKNFTSPGSVPDYFSNESGAILGQPSPAPDR